MGSYLIKMALDILNNNKDPWVLNNTFIDLISKCKKPSFPQDFRPISLCNVVMKTIANRLKRILPEVIDKE